MHKATPFVQYRSTTYEIVDKWFHGCSLKGGEAAMMMSSAKIPPKGTMCISLTKFSRSRSCPASLEASLTRAVLEEARSTYLNPAGTPTGVDQTDSIDPAMAPAHIADDVSSSNNSKGTDKKNSVKVQLMESPTLQNARMSRFLGVDSPN